MFSVYSEYTRASLVTLLYILSISLYLRWRVKHLCRDLLPLSSESSLACQAYYDKGYPCAANVHLCSALMAIKLKGLFNVPHIRWHGPTFYNGLLRGPVTLTPYAESLVVELSLPALRTEDCRGWNSKTKPCACRANALNHCATAAAAVLLVHKKLPYVLRIDSIFNLFDSYR